MQPIERPGLALVANRWSRREVILALGFGSLAGLIAGCGAPIRSATGAANFSGRFAAYPVAEEPNGDLAKVVWPEYVTSAGPDVRRLYEFQVANGDLMRYMPCFCGCYASGHQNNRDCYIKDVNPDGTVVFDPMAPT